MIPHFLRQGTEQRKSGGKKEEIQRSESAAAAPVCFFPLPWVHFNSDRHQSNTLMLSHEHTWVSIFQREASVEGMKPSPDRRQRVCLDKVTSSAAQTRCFCCAKVQCSHLCVTFTHIFLNVLLYRDNKRLSLVFECKIEF